MEKRAFGRAGFRVSMMGLGCSGIGGGLYGQSRTETLRLLQATRDRGINFYDTAIDYSGGDSERLLGQAFAGQRDQVIIATKAGPVHSPLWRGLSSLKKGLKPVKQLIRPLHRQANKLRSSQKRYDFSVDNIQLQLETSLRRLQTDYVDVLLLDRPDEGVLAAGNFVELMAELKKAGKIRCFGVACNTPAMATAALAVPGIDGIQVPVSLLERETYLPVICRAEAQGVAVMANEPLGKGLLTDSRKHTLAESYVMYSPDKIRERKAQAEALRVLATPTETLAQLALAYVMNQPGITTVIPGMLNLEQLEENLGALSLPAPDPGMLCRINSISGSPADALQPGMS